MGAADQRTMVVLMPDKQEDGFLSRWSQRKRQVEAENAKSAPAENTAETSIKTADENTDAEIADDVKPEPSEEELEMQANLEAAEAVDLETLEYDSDFEVFLKKGVPDALKNAAMQKLWRSNPVLAVLDGLNDYDEDFGDAKLNVYKSAWDVGRGFLTDEEMNHNPVDRVKAALEKLVDVEPAAPAVESLASLEIDAADREETIPAEPTDEINEELPSEIPLANALNVEAAIEEEPKRVSIRSRLFDQADDEA